MFKNLLTTATKLASSAIKASQPVPTRVTTDVKSSKHITNIVIHCSATQEGSDIGRREINQWHNARGFNGIGYHYVVRLDGTVELGRPENVVGAHVKSFNTNTIGVCYVGGLDRNGKAKDTRTPEQKRVLRQVVAELQEKYPGAVPLGHRDFSPDRNHDGIIQQHEWIKECPCFDVASEL